MNGKPQASDNELLWVLAGTFVLVIAIWFLGHEKISAFVMKLRSFETHLLVFDPEAREALRDWLAATAPKDATLKDLWNSGMAAGRSLRWVVLVILTALFGYLFYKSPDRSSRYSRKYTTDSLAEQESDEWRAIKPVLGRKLIDVPLDDPINGMRMRPRDYGRKHGFIVPIAGLSDNEKNSVNIEVLDEKDVLRLDVARAVFSRQLGSVWQGVPSLRLYEKALFAAFAAQINNTKENKASELAQQILDDLSVNYVRAVEEKNISLIDSPLVAKAIEEYGNTKAVARIVSRHAYVRTVMVSMLLAARDNGVLPPSWFRWLKTVDRVTWYALNDLGLDVASVEAGGVRAHWLAESMTKTPIVNPMIEPALIGLKTNLGEIIDVEEDD